MRGTMDLQKLTLEPDPPFDLGVRDNFIRCRDEQNLRIPPEAVRTAGVLFSYLYRPLHDV